MLTSSPCACSFPLRPSDNQLLLLILCSTSYVLSTGLIIIVTHQDFLKMQLPYRRPRLLEFHDQPWCPPVLRQHIQALLTLLWVHRIPPFQSRAPYELASDHLEQVVREIEDSHGSSSPAEKSNAPRGRIRVVDCCSGAGGPMPSIERRVKLINYSISNDS